MQYFRHYKGNYYRLVGEASHSETLEPMVIYQAMYGEKKLWVRPKAMFYENVTLANGNVVPRFAPVVSAEAWVELMHNDASMQHFMEQQYDEMKDLGFTTEDFGLSCIEEKNEFVLDKLFANIRKAYPDYSHETAEEMADAIYGYLRKRYSEDE